MNIRSFALVASLVAAATIVLAQPAAAATAAEVIADEGFAKSTTTTTVKDKIYAFIFNQSGAMVGIGIQGNKITKIKK